MSKAKQAPKSANSNTGNGKGGNKQAPAAAAKTTATNEGSESGNDGEGDGKGAPATDTTIATPAAPAATVAPKAATKKAIPVKGVRKGGGGKSKLITYNIAEAKYADEATKGDDTGFLQHIINGNAFATWNGDTRYEIDVTKPVYATLAEAMEAKAPIEFGMTEKTNKLYSFISNTRIQKAGGTQFTSLGKLVPGTGDNEGKMVFETGGAYHGFIAATAENVEQVEKNLKAYLDSPLYGLLGDLFTILPAPYKLTYPNPPATVGGTETANTSDTENDGAENEGEGTENVANEHEKETAEA